MPLGTEVGPGPGHIVLHRDPAFPTSHVVDDGRMKIIHIEIN